MDLLTIFILVLVVPIAVYSCARLITHAVLKTRQDFNKTRIDNNGGG